MKQPTFSVIIPAYGRPRQLTNCLQALAHLHYPREQFEVIIVDDGSMLPLDEVIAAFYDQLDVTLLKQAHAGPAAARNTGAAHAKGQFFVFTDDDCLPALDWLQTLQLRLATTPNQIIGGQTRNALPANPYSTASQVIIDMVYAYYNADPGQARFFASNNLALPAIRFHAIGGFDATFTTSEDRELCDRWRHHGYGMTYAPEVIVYHAHALTLHTFWRQHFNYGRGAFHFHEAQTKYNRAPIKVEPLSFYFDLLRYPLAQASGWRALRLTALMAVTQTANAAGFFRERRLRKKMPALANAICKT
jgi:glycosyltransferase involved in cell wall biosynthesis